MKKYITKQSDIKGAGKGLFTKAAFKKGEVIGLAHVDGQPTIEIGKNHNHNEKTPTANNVKNGNKRYLVASRDLKPGEEITTNYRLQPELEQPEDFEKKKGGNMTPQKDGYRTYSPFKKLPYIDVESDTIDSNNIVYDLNLQADNGLTKFVKKNTGLHTLPGAKIIREIPAKRKGGMVSLPKDKPEKSKKFSRSLDATNRLYTENNLFKKPKSRRNKVFDPHAKYYAEGGTYEETELTPEEIEAYRAEGYTVDDNQYQDGGEVTINNVTYVKYGDNWVNKSTGVQVKDEGLIYKLYNTKPTEVATGNPIKPKPLVPVKSSKEKEAAAQKLFDEADFSDTTLAINKALNDNGLTTNSFTTENGNTFPIFNSKGEYASPEAETWVNNRFNQRYVENQQKNNYNDGALEGVHPEILAMAPAGSLAAIPEGITNFGTSLLGQGLSTAIPLGEAVTAATAGSLTPFNILSSYFGADALVNQFPGAISDAGEGKYYDAADKALWGTLGVTGLGLGKQVFKPVYNSIKGLSYKGVPKELPGSPNAVDNVQKAGFLNPLALIDRVTPRLPAIPTTFPLGIEDDVINWSPLNLIPGYGKKLAQPGFTNPINSGNTEITAYRKFGNSLDDLKNSKTFRPQGGFRMGAKQVQTEGNWAEPGIANENYKGVFAAGMDPRIEGTNIQLQRWSKRNGVVGMTKQGNPAIPITDPGLEFHRRLPFSNRYVPIDKQKLIDNKFQLATQLPHVQSLIEKYGIAAAYALIFGYISNGKEGAVENLKTVNKYTIDPAINWSKTAWDALEDKLNKKQFGGLNKFVGSGYIETELTPEEIEEYRRGGFTVEEIY